MTEQPKPCPLCHCTSTTIVRPQQVARTDYRYVECVACGTRGPATQGGGAAIRAWNNLERKPGGADPLAGTKAVWQSILDDQQESYDS